MTTQIMFMPSSLVQNYESTGRIEADEFIKEILTKGIESSVKQLILDEFISQIETFFDDMEKSRQDIIDAYSSLQKMMKELSDRKIISVMRNHYSPILSSNFTFALRHFSGLIQGLLVGIQHTEIPEKKLPDELVRRLKEDMKRIIEATGCEMPDATKVSAEDTEYASLLAGAIVGFNIAMSVTLIIILAVIVRSRIEISKRQLEEMEENLRDWTQETMAQLTLVTRHNQLNEALLDLQGIIADDDDAMIVEEGL